MSGLLPSIMFKKHILTTFWISPLLDNRLKFIIYALAGFTIEEFSKSITITSIYREGDRGVHGHWRGIDIRSFCYEEEEIKSIVKFLNETIDYGNPPYQTALYHDSGQGNHIHIQVTWKRYNTLKKIP